MKFDLATMWRRARNPRRREVALRKIEPRAMHATNLYQSVYAPVIDIWNTAIARILDEYGRSIDMLQDSPSDIGTALQSTEDRVNGLMLTLQLRLDQWASAVEVVHRSAWRGAVLTATGVDIGTLIGPADMRETIQGLIQRNVGLIRDVNTSTRNKLTQVVFDGFQQRTPVREISKRMREVTDFSRKRALRIAADQNVKLSSALNEERRREAGISKWKWVHSGKLHYRPEHKARNGKIYDDNAKNGGMKPPADRPGQEPGCGCTSQSVVSLDDF